MSVEIHTSIVEFRSGLINDGYKHHTSQIIKKKIFVNENFFCFSMVNKKHFNNLNM